MLKALKSVDAEREITLVESNHAMVFRQIAKTAHSVITEYSLALPSPVEQEVLPPYDIVEANAENGDEQAQHVIDSTYEAVLAIISGEVTTAQDLHNKWRRSKLSAGWSYGPVKSYELKQHPNLIAGGYDALPAQERLKDVLFLAVVQSFTNAEGEI